MIALDRTGYGERVGFSAGVCDASASAPAVWVGVVHMYDVRRHMLHGARTAGRVLVATALVLVALPVSSAYAPPTPVYGGIWGALRDASIPSAVPAGIKVQAFLVGGPGYYIPDAVTYTDAEGVYGLAVKSGQTYRIVYSDVTANPHQVYADKVFTTAGYIEGGTNIAVTGGSWYYLEANMDRASTIAINVKRAGQWATPLKAIVARVVDTSVVATRAYTTDADGFVVRGGVPADPYRVSVSDPSGKFGSVVLPSTSLTHALGVDSEWDVNVSMPLLHSSANIVVSKPSSGSSVKHGVKLSVSGTLSKAVTNPKTMRLDAYQWSPGAMAWVLNRSATLKIAKSGSKSKYSGTIKFPWAGKWRLAAVFTGNSTYAQSGSTYRDVKVN